MTRLLFIGSLVGAALFAGSALSAAPAAKKAALALAAPFSDGAVLQREMKVPVWGTAAAGAKVVVTFAGQTVETTADAQGKWRVALAPMAASCESRTLRAESAGATAEAKDLLVGEVWFCAGQSNTEQPLVGPNPRFRDGKGAMRAQMTKKPLIRYCHQSNYYLSVVPKTTYPKKVEWKTFTPENLGTAPSFSAMGVYFALEIHSALGIPVGLVGTYWGGTRIEPWTPKSGLLSREETASLAEGKLYSMTDFQKLEKKPWKRPQDQPMVLWNEMVAPWTPYAMRGLIWYQGCSNAMEGYGYAPKMHALYNGWAKEFENPQMALHFVQIAPWGNRVIPKIQLGQAKFVSEHPKAKMAIINDLGNLFDIHPNDKETVGQRLAILALKYDYGFDIKADSPVVKTCAAKGACVELTFDHAASLYLYNPNRSVTAGFEICGADGVWKPAKILNLAAQKKGEKLEYNGIVKGGARLELEAEGVSEPKKIRYLHTHPWFGCVYNEVNLPLGAFVLDIR